MKKLFFLCNIFRSHVLCGYYGAFLLLLKKRELTKDGLCSESESRWHRFRGAFKKH